MSRCGSLLYVSNVKIINKLVDSGEISKTEKSCTCIHD